MTAATARHRTGSAGASRGREDDRSETSDATNAIAVLIRLPDLNEPASKEKTPQVAAGPIQPEDMATGDPSPVAQPPVSEEPDERATDVATPRADREPETSLPEEEPIDAEVATRSVFTVPRPVMQLAGVLALIGMFIGAYFAIVGGGDGNVNEDNGDLPGDQAPVDWAESPSTDPTEPVDISAAPPFDNGQQQELFADTPVDETGSDLLEPMDTREARDPPSLTLEPEPSVVLEPQFEEKMDLADSVPDGGSWMQKDQFAGFGVDSSKGVEGPDATTQPEDRSDGIAQGIEASQLGETVEVSPYKYPVTDPSNYQYPEDYHTMFQGSPDTSNAPGISPGPSERGIYGPYPGTARLRPPIDPPPVRR